jgi:hypothetical protein
MSYGYFPGQEAQALAFYKKMLETQTDEQIRKELTALVENLQKIVDEKQKQPISTIGVVQHTFVHEFSPR